MIIGNLENIDCNISEQYFKHMLLEQPDHNSEYRLGESDIHIHGIKIAYVTVAYNHAIGELRFSLKFNYEFFNNYNYRGDGSTDLYCAFTEHTLDNNEYIIKNGLLRELYGKTMDKFGGHVELWSLKVLGFDL